jgi:D-alanyl-D-alanine carboxypeptidase
MVFRLRLGVACGGRNFMSSPARAIFRAVPVLLATLLVAARPAHAVTHASILVDAKTGQVIEANNADALAHPASLTKLMTLYLTFERLQEGKLTLGSELYVSRHAAWQQPAKLWLRAGSSVSVRDCILGITGHSANDAAMVLAESIGGSETAFVDLMNQEARALGMTRTTFLNANGLPNAGQWTTARDMATLGLALFHTFPQYYHFFNTPVFTFQGRTYIGFDHLLTEYPGADGMKTGYIYTSGFNIVTSAVRGDRRLLGVVLGGRTAHARDLQMISLLDQGFATPSAATTLVAGAVTPAPPAEPTIVAQPVSRIAQPIQPAADPVRPAAERVRATSYRSTFDREHKWSIQVGAGYRTEHSVYRVLQSARRCAPTPLRRGHAEVVRVRRSDYQARFSDLSYPRARQACSALHTRGFGCRVLPHTIARRSEIVNAAAAILPSGE